MAHFQFFGQKAMTIWNFRIILYAIWKLALIPFQRCPYVWILSTGLATVSIWKLANFGLSKAGHGQDGGQTEKCQNKKVLVFYILWTLKVWIKSVDGTYRQTHRKFIYSDIRWRRQKFFSKRHNFWTHDPIWTFLVSLERSWWAASEKTYSNMIQVDLNMNNGGKL